MKYQMPSGQIIILFMFITKQFLSPNIGLIDLWLNKSELSLKAQFILYFVKIIFKTEAGAEKGGKQTLFCYNHEENKLHI